MFLAYPGNTDRRPTDDLGGTQLLADLVHTGGGYHHLLISVFAGGIQLSTSGLDATLEELHCLLVLSSGGTPVATDFSVMMEVLHHLLISVRWRYSSAN